MKKRESLFLGVGLLAALCVVGAVLWNHNVNSEKQNGYVLPTTKYGAFLAAQHAIYVNDFDSAARFSQSLTDLEYPIVNGMRYMSEFLSGKMPYEAPLLNEEKAVPAKLIYDAYLIREDKWDEVYKRHKKDNSAFMAPLRIWSSVATGHVDDALKFIDGLATVESWKNFVRGQVYAETGNIEKAADYFALVRPDFMNINDYLCMMSFYTYHGMTDFADALRADFTSKPAGMFMLEYDKTPDWSTYSGYQNALAFSVVQNVSHTQIMMYSDLSILLLRFAQITGPAFHKDNDAINYYLGQFFFNNTGDWKECFDKVDKRSPFYAFTILRNAEKTGNIQDLKQVVKSNPLFAPAVQKTVAYDIKHGKRRDALRTINRTLKDDNLSDVGRAFFLKTRAQIYLAFENFDSAQKDLHSAAKILTNDVDIVSMQAKIWAAQNREIENAYDYAMKLVRKNPSDVLGWDTLGRVIVVREGDNEALELIERVGNIAVTCSSLFDLLGDLYARTGQTARARDAYMRAINLSDDGLVVVPVIEKKLRNLK